MSVLALHCHKKTVTGLCKAFKLRSTSSTCLQLRHYAKKPPESTLKSGRSPYSEETFISAKAQSKGSPGFEANVRSLPRQGLQRYGITPGRLILVSVLVYFGYRLYNWQTNPHRSLVLNGKFFTPFILDAKDRVSSTSSIFNLLSVPSGQNTSNITEARKLGVWSVQVMQPELQIARSYTPLPPNDKSPAEQIRLLVRREPQGEVSGFLHKLAPGTIVHLRGPHPEYLIPDDVDEVLFLAGGTGIAPALQVAHCLYEARGTATERLPTMRILWANRRLEDSYAGLNPSPIENIRASIMAKIRAGFDFDSAEKTPSKLAEEEYSKNMSEQSLLVGEVDALKSRYNGNVNIEYFVDDENTFITKSLLNDRLTTASPGSSHEADPARKKLLLVSGPEGFIDVFAGPKSMHKGKEIQGPVGGVLGSMNRGAWEVWKL